MKRKHKKIAKQIGMGAGIVGGVVAAGYAATRLINHSRDEKSLDPNSDADRAGDLEADSTFELADRASSELPVEGQR